MSSLRLGISHGTVGTRSFAVKADDNVSIDLGGNKSERIMNGDGTSNKQLTRKGWELSSISVSVDFENGDLEFLQGVQDSLIDATITYQHTDDVTYSGVGSIEGDLKGTVNDGYVSLTLTGGGVLNKI